MEFSNMKEIVEHLDSKLIQNTETKIAKNIELAELNIELNLLQTRIKKLQDGTNRN
jgi:predicted nuclease with TOPRIM domain